jgi:hypothetical protein
MGADLLITTLPVCELTKSRKAQLQKCICSLKYIKDRTWSQLFDPEVAEEDIKKQLLEGVKEYESLQGLRTVVRLSPQGGAYDLWISGGMSWGDYPSEAYAWMAKWEWVGEIMELLCKWAKEDLIVSKKPRKKTSKRKA